MPNFSIEEIRRRYEEKRRQRRLPGNPTRSITQEQLEYAHDSESYRPPAKEQDTTQDKSSGNKPSYTIAEQIRRRNQQRAEQDAAAQDYRRSVTAQQLEYAHDSNAYRPPTSLSTNRQNRAQKKSSGEQPLYSIGEQILRRNRQRAWQDAMAQKLEQSPQSVDDSPDYAEDEPRESVSVAPVLKPLSEGQRMDAEVRLGTESDENLRGVLIALLREGLPPEDRFEEFLSLFAAWGLDAGTNQRMLGLLEEIAYSNWDAYLAESHILPYLNESTREYLEEHFPEEDLTTRDELQSFLQGRLDELVPEFNDHSIKWDILTAEGMVLVYYAALKAGIHAYHSDFKPHEYKVDERIAISDEMDIIEGLLNAATVTPLEDTDALLEAYNWEREEYAVAYLRPQVELIYRTLGVSLPRNWADYQDAVVLANMLVDGIELLDSRRKSDETFLGDNDLATDQLRREYFSGGSRTIAEDYATLAAIQTPDLYPFIRFAIGFFKPADLVATTAEVYHSLFVQGDLGAAASDVAGFFIPGKITKSTLKYAFPGANDMLLDVAVSATLGALGNVHPGEGPIHEEDFADALLKGLHSKALEGYEVPDGWIPTDWYQFLNFLNPEGGQFTQQGLIGALELGFGTQIRQELKRQQ